MPVYVEKVKDKNGKYIEKKVNGQKQYFIKVCVDDEFGKKKQITRRNKKWLGRNGYNLALQEEIRLKNKTVISKVITINDLATEYLKSIRNSVKISTYLKYQDNINHHILLYFDGVRADKITNKNIQDWKEKLNNKYIMSNSPDLEKNKVNHRNKKLSLSFKKGVFMTFNAIFKYGEKIYNLDNNPLKNVGTFKGAKGQKEEMKIMSEKQFNDEFLNNVDNEDYKLAYIFLFYSGLRRGEMMDLEWKNINFKNNTMTTKNTFNPKLEKYYKDMNITPKESGNKTDESRRTLLMLPRVKQCLLCLKEKYPNSSKPFYKITASTLKRKCDNACKKIGIDDFKIHCFRHSFTSMCLDKGVPIEVISQYLGHKKISITLDIYSHLLPNAQQKLLDKFL